jgi:hypothetical protein
MTINVKVGNPSEDSNPIKVTIKPKSQNPDLTVEITGEKQETLEFQLKMRSALNGDLMILDHKDIDIVVQQGNKKVVTFAKEIMSDVVYGAESRLLEFLRKQGIIQYDSIQGGNIYGSLEGTIMDSEVQDPIKATVLNISEWMKKEQPYIQGTTAYEKMEDDELLEPDPSTALGDVPQAPEKGSIEKDTIFAPYVYGRYTY